MEDEEPTLRLSDAEAWAREHVHLFSGEFHGKSAITWIAQITADGQLFEQRARGEVVSETASDNAPPTQSFATTSTGSSAPPPDYFGGKLA